MKVGKPKGEGDRELDNTREGACGIPLPCALENLLGFGNTHTRGEGRTFLAEDKLTSSGLRASTQCCITRSLTWLCLRATEILDNGNGVRVLTSGSRGWSHRCVYFGKSHQAVHSGYFFVCMLYFNKTFLNN